MSEPVNLVKEEVVEVLSTNASGDTKKHTLSFETEPDANEWREWAVNNEGDFAKEKWGTNVELQPNDGSQELVLFPFQTPGSVWIIPVVIFWPH